MHKVHDLVTKEIHDLVKGGMTVGSVHILGELIDIRKDIEEMWYWDDLRNAMKNRDYVDVHADALGYPQLEYHDNSVDAIMNDMKKMDEKLKVSNSPATMAEFKKKADELYTCVEKIKGFVDSMGMDADMKVKFKAILK